MSADVWVSIDVFIASREGGAEEKFVNVGFSVGGSLVDALAHAHDALTEAAAAVEARAVKESDQEFAERPDPHDRANDDAMAERYGR